MDVTSQGSVTAASTQLARNAGGGRQFVWTWFALLCVLATSPLLAANFTVTKVADTNDGVCDANDCSLREAIVAANALAGSDHIILGSGLTYTLTLGPADPSAAPVAASGDLDITDAVTIDGNGSTIDAALIDRVLDIQGNFTVTINNLTIRNGSAKGFLSSGGGINIRGATVVLNACVVTGNSTAVEGGSRDDGGGIAVYGSFNAPTATTALAHLTLNGTTVTGNTAANGGGILCALCALTIANSTVSSNTADGGDGGGIDVVGNGSTVVMANSTLASNSVTGGSARGGGLSVPFGTNVSTLSLDRIVNNIATAGSAVSNNIGTINGDNDWWGCNYGPGTGGTGCTGTPNGVSGPFLMSRFLVMRTTASPPTIPLNATSIVAADLTFNSLNATTVAGGTVPNGIPATFTATGGTLVAATEPTSNGKALDLYTAIGPKGTAALSATVDGQLVATSINIGFQSFTDDPLIARVTVVRAVHMAEMRARIDAIRAHLGLAAFAYTTPVPIAGAVVRREHILDLRAALAQAYAAAARAVPVYTDSTLPAGTTIKVVHVAEVRAAIIAIE
jgi:CSLREA domain-containing protein